MYFLIFQPEDMLKLCFDFNGSQPIHVFKRYAYEKRAYFLTFLPFLLLHRMHTLTF